MAIKPILFNTEMVKAILDGRKTQTRRVCKSQPQEPEFSPVTMGYEPPYKAGDILWVRESWCEPYAPGKYAYRADYNKDFDIVPNNAGGLIELSVNMFRWHPSIHMKMQAARIFLRVKDVRVERLQDISVLDAINEGCCGTICDHTDANPEHGCTDCYNTGWLERPETEFALLWDTTVNKADLTVYGWDANPWVYVIQFERCEKPEGW